MKFLRSSIGSLPSLQLRWSKRRLASMPDEEGSPGSAAFNALDGLGWRVAIRATVRRFAR